MLTPVQLVANAKKTICECEADKVIKAVENQQLIIDVREPDEYQNGYIPSAVNVPRGLLEFAIGNHPQVKPYLNNTDITMTSIIVYCKSGGRSALAAQSLVNMGFTQVTSLDGGIQKWEADGHKLEKTSSYRY